MPLAKTRDKGGPHGIDQINATGIANDVETQVEPHEFRMRPYCSGQGSGTDVTDTVVAQSNRGQLGAPWQGGSQRKGTRVAEGIQAQVY